jgi:hypothetical protein
MRAAMQPTGSQTVVGPSQSIQHHASEEALLWHSTAESSSMTTCFPSLPLRQSLRSSPLTSSSSYTATNDAGSLGASSAASACEPSWSMEDT